MRVEYEELKPGVHSVEIVDDHERCWRTDVRVFDDVRAEDGRTLMYRGWAIAGKLPRAALEALMIEEFDWSCRPPTVRPSTPRLGRNSRRRTSGPPTAISMHSAAPDGRRRADTGLSRYGEASDA